MALRRKRVGIAKFERECTQSRSGGRNYDGLCHARCGVAERTLEAKAGASDALVERVANLVPVLELERTQPPPELVGRPRARKQELGLVFEPHVCTGWNTTSAEAPLRIKIASENLRARGDGGLPDSLRVVGWGSGAYGFPREVLSAPGTIRMLMGKSECVSCHYSCSRGRPTGGMNDHTPRSAALSLTSVGGIDRGATPRSSSHGTHMHDVENPRA